METIILFGGIGNLHQFGGELTKNKEIIHRLKSLGYDVKLFDCYNCRSDKIKLIKLLISFFLYVFFHPNVTIIFSSAFNNIYPFLKIFEKLRLRNRIIYWVIGGLFAQRVSRGEFNQKVLQIIDLFIVEGDMMKLEMITNGYNNVIVIPNFKTIGKTYKNEERLKDVVTKFLFLSRIIPEKGVNYILNAVEKLNSLGYSEKFIVDFFGSVDSKFETEFENKIDRLPNVRYKGKINLFDEKGYECLSHYHFMLFPTFWSGEGFPGVVIDAYKVGIPIIASNWNFNEEFIENNVSGIIIPYKSMDALKNAMLKAIEMPSSDFSNLVSNCNYKANIYNTLNVLSEKTIKQIINNN